MKNISALLGLHIAVLFLITAAPFPHVFTILLVIGNTLDLLNSRDLLCAYLFVAFLIATVLLLVHPLIEPNSPLVTILATTTLLLHNLNTFLLLTFHLEWLTIEAPSFITLTTAFTKTTSPLLIAVLLFFHLPPLNPAAAVAIYSVAAVGVHRWTRSERGESGTVDNVNTDKVNKDNVNTDDVNTDNVNTDDTNPFSAPLRHILLFTPAAATLFYYTGGGLLSFSFSTPSFVQLSHLALSLSLPATLLSLPNPSPYRHTLPLLLSLICVCIAPILPYFLLSFPPPLYPLLFPPFLTTYFYIESGKKRFALATVATTTFLLNSIMTAFMYPVVETHAVTVFICASAATVITLYEAPSRRRHETLSDAMFSSGTFSSEREKSTRVKILSTTTTVTTLSLITLLHLCTTNPRSSFTPQHSALVCLANASLTLVSLHATYITPFAALVSLTATLAIVVVHALVTPFLPTIILTAAILLPIPFDNPRVIEPSDTLRNNDLSTDLPPSIKSWYIPIVCGIQPLVLLCTRNTVISPLLHALISLVRPTKLHIPTPLLLSTIVVFHTLLSTLHLHHLLPKSGGAFAKSLTTALLGTALGITTLCCLPVTPVVLVTTPLIVVCLPLYYLTARTGGVAKLPPSLHLPQSLHLPASLTLSLLVTLATTLTIAKVRDATGLLATVGVACAASGCVMKGNFYGVTSLYMLQHCISLNYTTSNSPTIAFLATTLLTLLMTVPLSLPHTLDYGYVVGTVLIYTIYGVTSVEPLIAMVVLVAGVVSKGGGMRGFVFGCVTLGAVGGYVVLLRGATGFIGGDVVVTSEGVFEQYFQTGGAVVAGTDGDVVSGHRDILRGMARVAAVGVWTCGGSWMGPVVHGIGLITCGINFGRIVRDETGSELLIGLPMLAVPVLCCGNVWQIQALGAALGIASLARWWMGDRMRRESEAKKTF